MAEHQPGPYQPQAAIAAVHDEAPSFEVTDWEQIVAHAAAASSRVRQGIFR
jgi:predicted RNA polymerase sigma factor